MQISWTRLPFRARNRQEFNKGLNDWLGEVFYETLPAQGYEIREEQIYTTFRMARAFTDGRPLFAEAGPGTGKTFAYLLPAICYARFTGKPVLITSASGVLQAQLSSPAGDIQTLSRLLDLQVDARVAPDPADLLCEMKGRYFVPARSDKAGRALERWTRRTATGARSEVPDIPDHLWAEVAWDPALPCDTCRQRGTCKAIAARRHYRAAGDLVVADHRLFALDLLTRQERQQTGRMPYLPAYAAVVLDEGQHLPETWQRGQGYLLSAGRLRKTLELIHSGYGEEATGNARLAEARQPGRRHLTGSLLPGVTLQAERFIALALEAAAPGEGKRHLPRAEVLITASLEVTRAVESLQDDLVTEEAMQEGTANEQALRAYQARLDEVLAALELFRSPEAVPWVEGEDLWVVPRRPLTLYGEGRLQPSTPVLFSSATLEPDYSARLLQLPSYDSSRVGVPFNLGEQVLIYEPAQPAADLEQVAQVIRAMGGRSLILVNSLAEVQRYKAGLNLPWRLFCEGDAERGAMLQAFRDDRDSCLVGASFWEGVDVPGEPLSCVIIPRLPFPAHDPLIRERREQAAAAGQDPFGAVDLPEMLLKLKQGAGRLIRTARDRGVLALLDRSYLTEPWAELVDALLPADSERTADLDRVARFCASEG